jgi:hypothetical protein
MEGMIALVALIAILVLAALAQSYGYDSRDFEPRDAIGGLR